MTHEEPQPKGPPTPVPTVLELRIHGVNNTPPAGMLDLPDDAIEQVAGDTLGSFWRPKDETSAKLTAADRGWVPPGITREAYSWGGMARNSIGGVSGWQKFVAIAGRLGWTLLLPFGLINVAYWSRRLDGGPPTTSTEKKPPARSGAATLRLIGVLMTLLVTAAVIVVSMDDVATQCYADEQHECKNLPSLVGAIGHWSPAERLALLSFVPLLLLVFLWALSAKTRTTYDSSTWVATGREAADAYGAATAKPDWPILRTTGFWQHHVISSKTAFLHLAAGATLIAGLTSWQGIFGTSGCRLPGDVFSRGRCHTQLTADGGRSLAELIIVALCAALLIIVAVLTIKGSSEAADIPSTTDSVTHKAVYFVIGGAFAVFLLQEGFLIWWHTDKVVATHLVGLSNAITAILCLLFGLSLSALFLRRYGQGWVIALGLGEAVLLILSGVSGAAGWVWRIGAVLVFAGVLLAVKLGGAKSKYEAWRGCAPGVIVLLALLIAMTLLTAFVVGVGDVLNGANSAGALAGRPPAPVQPPCKYSCDTVTEPVNLLLPQPFIWFGPGLLIILALLILVLANVALRVWLAPGARRAAIVTPRPLTRETPADLVRTRSARRFAQVAHRGEPMLGLIALLGSIGLLSAILVAVSWTNPHHLIWWKRAADGALGAGTWAAAGVGALVIGFTAGGSVVGGKRPFGLLWDLVCFLPRAGHPLGPPCYAERAVPELVTRCDRYLTPKDDSDVHGQKVILSAHSLGSVIAVGAIFASDGDPRFEKNVGRLSLLTYGTQLRAYFGRIFPELLGPKVLGNHPVEPATLVDPNPVVGTTDEPATSNDHDLASLLEVRTGHGRWRSLWRRTDYLGFPVYNGVTTLAEDPAGAATVATNDVDRAAAEIDRTGYMLGVLSHSDYPRTAEYRAELEYLRDTGQGSRALE